MWLTGTDIPCLHTLYVDKPMKGHSMIQAISRVNRVFRDKPHGLIVDYIGIGEELREATGQYSAGGGRGEPAPDVGEEARGLFFEELDAVRKLLPDGIDYRDWRALSRIDYEDRFMLVTGTLLEDEALTQQFLAAESRLSKAFLLVKHLDDCRARADEVIYYQIIRKNVRKAQPGSQQKHDELERAVRDLVDTSIATEGVVDIFAISGIEKPDISILDDEFLQTFKDKPHQNLRLKLLEKLIRDEIQHRAAKNLARAKGFKELLEETLSKYHNRLIDAASVIEAMIRIRREMENDDKRAEELGLSEEELAFYDAIADNYATIYDNKLLSEVVHEVVSTIKKNLKVDWTKPHRMEARAAIRAAVKRILRKKKLKPDDFDEFLNRFMEQAEALWADWPSAA
jgi:type I restriction enzyme R subunit